MVKTLSQDRLYNVPQILSWKYLSHLITYNNDIKSQ